MSEGTLTKWVRRLRHAPGRLRSVVYLWLGVPVPIRSLDRKVLETVILPSIAKDRHRILFVGCDFYTAHYRSFFRRNDYHTIDFDPGKRKYGSRQHTVGSALELPKFYKAGFFDAVIFNGIFGYGIHELADAETAIAACKAVLKPDGALVVGWNDQPDIRAIFDHCSELRIGLEPHVFEPLGVAQTEPLDSGRHVYSFYIKPSKG